MILSILLRVWRSPGLSLGTRSTCHLEGWDMFDVKKPPGEYTVLTGLRWGWWSQGAATYQWMSGAVWDAALMSFLVQDATLNAPIGQGRFVKAGSCLRSCVMCVFMSLWMSPWWDTWRDTQRLAVLVVGMLARVGYVSCLHIPVHVSSCAASNLASCLSSCLLFIYVFVHISAKSVLKPSRNPTLTV